MERSEHDDAPGGDGAVYRAVCRDRLRPAGLRLAGLEKRGEGGGRGEEKTAGRKQLQIGSRGGAYGGQHSPA